MQEVSTRVEPGESWHGAIAETFLDDVKSSFRPGETEKLLLRSDQQRPVADHRGMRKVAGRFRKLVRRSVRIRGWGPPYQKPAPKILRYHPPEVRNWLKERARIASSHHDRKIAAKASREVLRKRDDTSRSAPRIPLHRKNRAGGC